MWVRDERTGVGRRRNKPDSTAPHALGVWGSPRLPDDGNLMLRVTLSTGAGNIMDDCVRNGAVRPHAALGGCRARRLRNL